MIIFSAKPNIPVISITIKQARVLLAKFTDARNVGKEFWFGLPLNTSSDAVVSNYRATVSVNHDPHKNVTLRNVHATIQGKIIKRKMANYFMKTK